MTVLSFFIVFKILIFEFIVLGSKALVISSKIIILESRIIVLAIEINCLITDCNSSYKKFAKENNINLEQIKSGTHVNSNGYNLGNINSLHSELATFLSHFKSVSTKHLQHYLDWFCFQKLINYTVEILDQPLTVLKKSVINVCSTYSNNVYDNTSGIDFCNVYSDYNFSPLTIYDTAINYIKHKLNLK